MLQGKWLLAGGEGGTQGKYHSSCDVVEGRQICENIHWILSGTPRYVERRMGAKVKIASQ